MPPDTQNSPLFTRAVSPLLVALSVLALAACGGQVGTEEMGDAGIGGGSGAGGDINTGGGQGTGGGLGSGGGTASGSGGGVAGGTGGGSLDAGTPDAGACTPQPAGTTKYEIIVTGADNFSVVGWLWKNYFICLNCDLTTSFAAINDAYAPECGLIRFELPATWNSLDAGTYSFSNGRRLTATVSRAGNVFSSTGPGAMGTFTVNKFVICDPPTAGFCNPQIDLTLNGTMTSLDGGVVNVSGFVNGTF